MALATLAYYAAYLAGVVTGQREQHPWFESFGSHPLWLAAALAPLVAPLHFADFRTRLGVRAIGAAWLLSYCGEVLLQVPGLSNAAQLAAEWLYLAFYPSTLIAFALFIRWPSGTPSRIRLVTESAIMLVAGSSLAWYLVWSRPGAPQLASDAFTTAVIPYLEIAVLVTAAAALSHRDADAGQPVREMIGLAALMAAIGDLILVLLYDGPANPSTKSVGAALSLGAATLIVIAVARPGQADARWRGATGATLPYLAVSLVVMGLFHAVATGATARQLSGLVLGSATLTALVIGRLLLADRELRDEVAARLAQEARFRALIQGSSDAMLVVDPAGTIRFANQTAAEVLGEPVSGITGLPLAALPPDIAGALGRAIDSPSSGMGVVWSRGSDDRRRLLESISADLSHVPAIGGHVVVTRDVSERQRLEREGQLAVRLDAVSRLTGNIAHEFNNLLTVVRLHAELLPGEPNDNASAEGLREIEAAVSRGADLCRQLLSVGQHESLEQAPTDLARHLREHPPVVRGGAPGIRIVLETPASTPTVVVDPQLAALCVQALVDNAVEASTAGGIITVRVRVDGDHGAAPSSTGPMVILEVQDRGAGMAPEVAARATDIFFTTRGPRRNGLGLAVAAGAVAARGGRLVIDSTLGAGTTVGLRFPAAEPVGTSPGASAAANAATGDRPQVLLVDDEPALREVLARGLRRLGFDVVTASDGVEALDVLAATGSVAAVITDVVMPRMDGLELTQRLRVRTPGLPVVHISGHLGFEDASGASDAPRLAKPFATRDLARLLQELGIQPGTPR